MKHNKSLSNLILLSLEKSVEGYIQVMDYAYNPGKYFDGYPRYIKKPYILKTIKRLRERGLVDFISDENVAIRLTNRGLSKAIEEKINHGSQDWDGKWRLVIFDIPEKRRLLRQLLRYRLKEWGFVRWQGSVWASKRNCTKELRSFISKIGIKDWVLVVESDNVD